MCSKGRCAGLAFASFGAGLILALLFPTKFVIFTLAMALIALGIIIIK